MMPRFFPIVIALSWALMSVSQTAIGAVSPGVEDLPVAISRAAQNPRAIGVSLGLGDIDFPVSLRSLTLDLLAAQPASWPETPSAIARKSSASRKQAPAPFSIAMWFGLLGATILILPRFRRR
jgi:hypothetical protein